MAHLISILYSSLNYFLSFFFYFISYICIIDTGFTNMLYTNLCVKLLRLNGMSELEKECILNCLYSQLNLVLPGLSFKLLTLL